MSQTPMSPASADFSLLQDRDYTVILARTATDYPSPPPGARQRWEVAQASILNLIKHCEELDPDGVTLYVSCRGETGDCNFRKYEHVTTRNLASIVEAAREEGVFVWMDMEDPDTVDPTIEAFERSATEYDRMGLCVQANLDRTGDDLDRLMPVADKLRLVKGAYDPPPGAGSREKRAVNDAYRDLLGRLFREYDGTVAVGSHDPAMIEHAVDLHREHGTDFEIQMLMGVREDAQVDLARDYDVYQYVPYGTKWMSYFYRRAVERKENLAFALRAVAGI